MEIGAGTGLVGLVQARVASKVFITAHCRSLMRSGAVSGVSMKLPPSSREKKKTTTTAAMTGRWEGNCPAPWSVGQWESAATPPPLPMARASRVFFPPHEAQTSALRSSSPVCFFFIASGSTCAPIWPRAPHGMPADLQGSSGKRQGPALDLRGEYRRASGWIGGGGSAAPPSHGRDCSQSYSTRIILFHSFCEHCICS